MYIVDYWWSKHFTERYQEVTVGWFDARTTRKFDFFNEKFFMGGSSECWWPSNVGKRQRLATQPGLADLFLAARNSGGLSFGCWILFGIFMLFRIEWLQTILDHPYTFYGFWLVWYSLWKMIFGMILIKERRRKNRNVRQIQASPTFYGKWFGWYYVRKKILLWETVSRELRKKSMWPWINIEKTG